MIKPVQDEDIEDLVKLHLEVLPKSIQVKFGKNFIKVFYQSLIQDPDFFCDGYFLNSQLVGFDAYCPKPWKVFRQALRRNFLKYSVAVIQSTIKHPKLFVILTKVCLVLFRVPDEPAKSVKAEAINWGVHPDFRRSSDFYKETGIHVAKELHNHMIETMLNHNVDTIKIMPDAGDPKTVKFLQSDGWIYKGQVNRWGETLDVFILDIKK